MNMEVVVLFHNVKMVVKNCFFGGRFYIKKLLFISCFIYTF